MWLPDPARPTAPAAPPAGEPLTPLALSEDQRSVLRLLADGLSDKQIAATLRMPVAVVKSRLGPLYEALHTQVRSLAAARAVAHQTVTADDLTDLPLKPPDIREHDQPVLEHMVRGLSVKATAAALDRSEHTVRDAARRLRGELCARDAVKAASVATALGLISCAVADPRLPDAPVTRLYAAARPGGNAC
jgi:DNA-binding NarL/FixJ family response regulator